MSVRLTPSELRSAVTDPEWRPPPPPLPGQQAGGPSIESPLRNTIRAYHEEGFSASEARKNLAGRLTSDFWSGRGAGMRATAFACLNTYIRLAEKDARPASAGAKVTYADDVGEVVLEVPLIVVDPVGYDVRWLVAGPLPHRLTDEERVLLAAPAILAAAADLETEALWTYPVLGAQVWELRTGATGYVSRDDAEAARSTLTAMFVRLTGTT